MLEQKVRLNEALEEFEKQFLQTALARSGGNQCKAAPTAEWTMQQFRESVVGDEGYKFIIHDRDSIYSKKVDSSLRTLGLRVLRTPYRSPQANAFCERLIGSARRECLDFMIPSTQTMSGGS